MEKENNENSGSRKITELMLKEHARINQKINNLQDNIGNSSEELVVLLREFKQNLVEHFNLEEEAIFDLYNKISDEDEIADTFELMQEHGELLGNIKHIENELKKGKEYVPKNNLIVLKEKIFQHIKFENNTFYKELDEKLDEQEKEELIRHLMNKKSNDENK